MATYSPSFLKIDDSSVIIFGVWKFIWYWLPCWLIHPSVHYKTYDCTLVHIVAVFSFEEEDMGSELQILRKNLLREVPLLIIQDSKALILQWQELSSFFYEILC